MLNNKRLVAEIVNGEQILMTIDDNMLYCEFGALDRGNITDVVNWGIYANRGSISFIDNVGYFNNENINSNEIKNHTVNFYLVKNQKNLIATFNIQDVELEEETRTVNIELISKIISLNQEKITERIYPFYPRTLLELLELINEKCKRHSFNVGSDTENINHTFISCPYIGVDNIWNVLTKICQASMSRIIEKENGELEITSSFPNRTPIILNPSNIINVENAGFVFVNNANIDITQRTAYNNMILDGSSHSFSIKRDDGRLAIGSTGIVITNTEKDVDYNTREDYIDATVNIKTPYKIFGVSNDKSLIDIRHQMGDLSGSATRITEDKQYTTNSSICSNIKIEGENDISAKIDRFRIDRFFQEPEQYFTDILVTGGTIRFPVTTFVDEGVKTISITGANDGETIESNDLIQEFSSFYPNTGGTVPLGEYILSEVKKRYGKGIECFEIECLFNDYYYEGGGVAFSGGDLSTHFQKYDVIVPYVMKNGKNVPLRTNQDGTPKKFRVIGISYSYDGLLRQKLSVQEERYDVD